MLGCMHFIPDCTSRWCFMLPSSLQTVFGLLFVGVYVCFVGKDLRFRALHMHTHTHTHTQSTRNYAFMLQIRQNTANIHHCFRRSIHSIEILQPCRCRSYCEPLHVCHKSCYAILQSYFMLLYDRLKYTFMFNKYILIYSFVCIARVWLELVNVLLMWFNLWCVCLHLTMSALFSIAQRLLYHLMPTAWCIFMLQIILIKACAPISSLIFLVNKTGNLVG